jgi:hypothetical protein
MRWLQDNLIGLLLAQRAASEGPSLDARIRAQSGHPAMNDGER